MATVDLQVSSVIAASGWTGATVANLSSSNDVRATDGVADEFISTELDNAPGDFDSQNSVVLNIEARRQGTVVRDKTILVELRDSGETVLESFTTPILGATDALHSSSAFSRADSQAVIDGYRLRCTVQEGAGMPDSATVEIDHMYVTLDYNAIDLTDEEHAGTTGKGQQEPRFDPTDIVAYFEKVGALWLPKRRLVYG